jgi:hypothetical protein
MLGDRWSHKVPRTSRRAHSAAALLPAADTLPQANLALLSWQAHQCHDSLTDQHPGTQGQASSKAQQGLRADTKAPRSTQAATRDSGGAPRARPAPSLGVDPGLVSEALLRPRAPVPGQPGPAEVSDRLPGTIMAAH